MTEINNKIQVYRNCEACTGTHQHENEYLYTDKNGEHTALPNASTYTVTEHPFGPSFLSVTNKFDFSKLEGLVYADKVISGEVETETAKLQIEQDTINQIIDENTNASTEFSTENIGKFTSKIIGFERYEKDSVSAGNNLKRQTNTNNLVRNIQLSERYGEGNQKKIIEGAIKILAEWLDDNINNYEERVAEGKTNGETEVKLSFLLKLRKAIENCDFPVGFGNDEYFSENSSDDYVVLGAYSNSYYTDQYLNPTDHANDNNAVIQHMDRSILLNADVFMINRKYTSEAKLVSGINSGKFNYLNDESMSSIEQQEAVNKAVGEILMASDDVYFTFTQTYLASVLAHEFIHSTHIGNEAVTYNICEVLEDDFRNKIVYDGWKQSTQDAVDTILSGLNLNQITFGECILPTASGGGIGFHDLLPYNQTSSTKENVVEHGHAENMCYTNVYDDDGNILARGYADYGSGNTLDDDKKELMNFVV